MATLTIVLEPTGHPVAGYYVKNESKHSTKPLHTKPETKATGTEESESKMSDGNWKKKFEITLLIFVIVIVCSLFVTPTILYALPPLSFTQAVS